jgi:hypothetical protein
VFSVEFRLYRILKKRNVVKISTNVSDIVMIVGLIRD